MSSIDDRIVNMQFNNSQFENGVQQSIRSLDQLKQGLNLEGASRGLDQLNDSGKRFSLAGISEGVAAISERFTTMGLIGVTVLQNITNSAIEAGKQLISSLTIAPIMQGFREYNLQLNSTQTILANTQEKSDKVAQTTLNAIRENAAASIEQTKESNKESLEIFRREQSKKVKELNNFAKEERDFVKEKYDNEKEALTSYIDEENNKLQSAHDAKLKLYQSEYMEKLKVIDEDRYNKIKAIDDEIKGINNLNKTDRENLQIAQDKKKLSDLESKKKNARTTAEKKQAEKDIASFKEEMARKEIEKQRSNQIENLNIQKDSINTEYDIKKTQLQKEYQDKKDNENNINDMAKFYAKEQQDEKLKNLQIVHDTEIKLLESRQQKEKEALDEKQYLELKNMENSQKQELKNIQEQADAKAAALQKVALNTKIKGSTLEEVNTTLDELNEYADKTIYNFGQMTSNLGKFTAAGVNLKDSTTSIKGLSNVAAFFGVDIQQAAGAMYQLSQALASGTVKLLDWKSLETAGMSGETFQNSLIETARVHGVAIDKILAKEGGFRLSLDKGWLTTELLIETLNKYTGDMSDEQLKAIGYTEDQIKSIQKLAKTAVESATIVKTFPQLMSTLSEAAGSGWAKSWRLILGDLNQAKDLFTNINNVVGGFLNKMSDARNDMLELWRDSGGANVLIEALSKTFNVLVDVIKPIKDAFDSIFPSIDKFTQIELFKLSGGTSGLETTMLGRLTVMLKDFSEKLKISGETADKIKRTFKGVFAVFDIGGQIIKAIAGLIVRLIKVISPGTSIVLDMTAGFGDLLVSFNEMLKKGDVFNKVFQKIGDVIEMILKPILAAGKVIGTFFKSFTSVDTGGVTTFGDVLSNAFNKILDIIGWISKGITTLFTKMSESFDSGFIRDIIDAFDKKGFGSVLDLINLVLLGGIAVGLKKFIDSLKGITGLGVLGGLKDTLKSWQTSLKAGTLLKIAIAVGILAVSLLLLSSIDPNKMTAAISAITVLFIDLFGSMAAFSKIIGTNGFTAMGKITLAMIGISLAILVLSGAVKILGSMKLEQLGAGVGAIVVLLGALMGMVLLLSKQQATMMTGVSGLVMLAGAVLILSHAVNMLSQLEPEKLAYGVGAIVVLLGALMGMVLLLSKQQATMITGATGFLIIVGAVMILVKAVQILGNMDAEKMQGAVLGLVGIIGGLAFALKIMPSNIMKQAIGIGLIAGALTLVTLALAKLNIVNPEGLSLTLLAIGAAFILIATAVRIMPAKKSLTLGLSLLLLSNAMITFSKALKDMSTMSLEEIGRGLLAFAGSLLILGLAVKFIPGQQMILFAVGLAAMSGAMMLLAISLKMLGELKMSELGVALLALVGVFTVLGLAGYFVGPMAPLIIGLAVAIGILALAVLLVGGGFLLFAMAMSTLGEDSKKGIDVFVYMVKQLIDLIPYLMVKIGEGIVAFAKVMKDGIPVIMETVRVFFLELIKTYSAVVPTFITAVIDSILTLLEKIAETMPRFMTAGAKIILGFLKGISDNITEIVKTGISIVLNFLEGIRQKLPDIIDMALKMLTSLINGLADGIENNHKQLEDAIMKLINAIADTIISLVPKLIELGGTLVEKILDGMIKCKDKIKEAAKKVFGKLIDIVMGLFDQKSPSKSFEKIGENNGIGFINGMNKMKDKITKSATDMVDGGKKSIGTGISKIIDKMMNGDMDLQPTIRPVIDLSSVEAGLKSTFSKTQGINVSGITSKISGMATNTIGSQNGGNSGSNQITNNTDSSKFNVINNYSVRNDMDIRKIGIDQKTLLDKFARAKGVLVK